MKDDVNHSARRINTLKDALNASRYLEIGVAAGATFFGVEIDDKTAVDPRFRFDYAARATDKVRFFEMFSDDFFKIGDENLSYDIIFLDGLHVFGQTYRDFCATMAYATRRTLWIIDDTVPSDIYSAWPNQREAVDLRRRSGGKSGRWHGDVYKVIFAIRDYFPTLNYCTLPEANGQTLIWFETRKDFRPIFNSMESIERMSYFDFVKHESEMNFRSEAEGLNMAISAVRKHRPM